MKHVNKKIFNDIVGNIKKSNTLLYYELILNFTIFGNSVGMTS